MRSLRWSAFISWLIVASLATAGFAAFSPRSATAPPPTVRPTTPEVGNDAGRVLAMAFISASGETGAPAAPVVTSSLPGPNVEFDNSPPARPTSTTVLVATTSHHPAVSWPSGSNCLASWYGPGFNGRTTASGEVFDSKAMTGALHSVDFGTLVTVSRPDTGASVVVRINDRGPYEWRGGWYRHPTRCIDLSEAAMQALGGIGKGILSVTIEY